MLVPTTSDTAPDTAEVDARQGQHVDIDDRQHSGAGLRGEEGEVEQRAPVEGSGAQLLCHDDLVRDACRQRQRSFSTARNPAHLLVCRKIAVADDEH